MYMARDLEMDMNMDGNGHEREHGHDIDILVSLKVNGLSRLVRIKKKLKSDPMDMLLSRKAWKFGIARNSVILHVLEFRIISRYLMLTPTEVRK